MSDALLRPRLLIVESDESVRRVLGRVLARRFEVTPLSTGASAIGRLREERFDVLLLDLCLAGMSGIDLFRIARELDARLPVIVTTPVPDLRTEEAARALGAVAYVQKPYDTPDLQAPLERATQLASVRRDA